MDPIGVVSANVLPGPAMQGQGAGSAAQATVLPKPSTSEAQVMPVSEPQQEFDAAVADQKRHEAVQRAAENVADLFVVGDKRFTIFKDVTGQYITRFTSLRDGKVTYIPEPALLTLGARGDDSALLKIDV